jgi:hypothetical protein
LSNSAGLQKINGNDTENIIVSSEGWTVDMKTAVVISWYFIHKWNYSQWYSKK